MERRDFLLGASAAAAAPAVNARA
ncbi:MAG: hypothetical protein JWO72_3323, partial [Caulobacteraceae bacterium]|nr:hypothetical protein [Caulobacteraceae bacterium]